MKKPLRVLIAEDDPLDAEQVVRELRRAGFEPEWKRVDNEAEFVASLGPDLDLVLSDYTMPQFTGARALEVLQEHGVEVPFIIISGSIGEDIAVNVMKQGAADYLLKDRLMRLGQAITHATEKGRMRRERKHAEAALRESEERFRQLAENIQDVFWLTDMAKNRMLYISPAFEAIWGRSCADLYSSPRAWLDAIHPDDRERVLHSAVTKQSQGLYDEEYRIVRPDGSERWIRDRAFPVTNAAGEMDRVAGVARDITEQKELEARFLRAQRMDSIGTLASGVAHDLNNILAPIMMSASLLRRELNSQQREEIISTIEESAERGAQIIKQVLAFGRGLEGERCPLQASALIAEMMKIIRGTFPKNLTVECSIEPDLWLIIGDATQLHQVLLNLCVNARDAMPDGGKLGLAAKNLDLDASYASMLPEAQPGPHVVIEVCDTGTGIPPEIVERIFDPFFTTKGVGKGTGLGLSTTLGIVKSHGGFIQVSTQPGKGTTFRVYLPASPQADAPPSDVSREDVPEGHGELILVVDDEASVQSAARISLESAGYRVILAADGTEALAMFAMNSESVAAVLTDLMMPHMDGVSMIRALRAMTKNLPIIASTGLGEKVQLADLKAMNVEFILRKPYGANTLLRTLHEILHLSGRKAAE
jgi:two-component system, cell cycle sensor histidine kinase and response regulator CckA